MTKGEFVDRVADKAGLSKRDAGAAVDAVLTTIQDTLKGGGDVTLHRVRQVLGSEARGTHWREPSQPSQKVQIPAANVPKFSAGSGLKSAVRG